MATQLDYCGAGARLDPDSGLKLDPDRWAFQRKVDGCYVRVSTDARGCVANMLTRSGNSIAPEMTGINTGIPSAILFGEFEGHTEAGIAAATGRGWPLVHLFDAAHVESKRIASLPYRERLALLHQHQTTAELGGRLNPWTKDEEGDHHDQRGRYCRPVPRDARRFPVIETVRGSDGARELWRSYVERDGGEGLVAVRLDAVLGARNAKRKVKTTDTIDCTVIAVGGGCATLVAGTVPNWTDGLTFAVSARGRWSQLVPGAVVSVAHDGFYSSTVPRFPRLVGERLDLVCS